ncbi:hypothetical protein CW304_21220 [Bacillus sp. UFRGS-B20]|nr:hypothetical protein CW304_21220 [Bacillus sp. UFRGS-B20]
MSITRHTLIMQKTPLCARFPTIFTHFNNLASLFTTGVVHGNSRNDLVDYCSHLSASFYFTMFPICPYLYILSI